MHETPEGFLLCIGVPLARTGEQIYGKSEVPLEAGKDGTIVITRDEKEVFRPATLASFEGKAFTVKHPEEFVGPDNWQDLACGVLQNIRRGEGEFKDSMIADVLVTEAKAIELIKGGLREVSCGYEAEYIQTEPGRGRQTNIVGNHVALVEEGRAGSAHAINDHKFKGVTMPKTMGEKMKAFFLKTADDAAKLCEDEDKVEKKEKTSDDDGEGTMSLDGLAKMVKDLGEKMDGLKGAPAKKVAEDEDTDPPPAAAAAKEDAPKSLEERLKALEEAVAKLVERESKEDEVSVDADGDDESEETDDEDGDVAEAESMDSGLVETGDAARAEILAPGIAKTGDVKVKALKQAFATTDGKSVIEALNKGKAPDYANREKVDQLFIAASEVLKVSRSGEFAATKKATLTRDNFSITAPGAMTAEMLNEKNNKFYGRN